MINFGSNLFSRFFLHTYFVMARTERIQQRFIMMMTMMDTVRLSIQKAEKFLKIENSTPENNFQRSFTAPTCVTLLERMWTIFFLFIFFLLMETVFFSLCCCRRRETNETRRPATRTTNFLSPCRQTFD